MQDILDEIADLIPCQRYEQYLAVRCFFHADHNPSLLIYSKSYHCLSCEARGSTRSLLRYLRRGSLSLADVRIYRPTLWRTLSELDFDPEEIAIEAHKRLSLQPDLAYYLRRRRIDEETRRLMLGFLDGFYIFPVFDQYRNIVGIVARAGPVLQQSTGIRYLIPKGQDDTLLYSPDWRKVEQSRTLCLTFGLIDAIALNLCGFPAVTGTVAHNIGRDRVILDPIRRKRVYIIQDGDGRDRAVAEKVYQTLSPLAKIVMPSYPIGKDPADVLETQGKEALQALMTRATAQYDKYCFSIRERGEVQGGLGRS